LHCLDAALLVVSGRQDRDIEMAQHLGEPFEGARDRRVWDGGSIHPWRRIGMQDTIEIYGDGVSSSGFWHLKNSSYFKGASRR
jgi:hypothetical protein